MHYVKHNGMIARLPEIDPVSVARAFAAKPMKVKVARKPQWPAMSSDPCKCCGISGAKGCDHQLPCEPMPVIQRDAGKHY